MNTTISPGQARKRYMREFFAAVVAYIALLLISIHLLQHQPFSGAARVVVAALPALPMIWVFAAIVRYVNSIDELERRIHLEAFAFAAGGTALLGITYTFLEGVGFPRLSAWWAFVSIDLLWAASLPFIRRRYS